MRAMNEMERLEAAEKARLARMADAGVIDEYIASLKSSVPRDGDAAHRMGFKKSANPFDDGDARHAAWEDDWEFRHAHALPSAADAPGGRLRPTRD